MIACEACRSTVSDSETFYRQDGARICRGCHDVEDMGAATRRANDAAVPAWLTGAAALWLVFGLMRGQLLFLPLALLALGFGLTSYSFWQKGRA